MVPLLALLSSSKEDAPLGPESRNLTVMSMISLDIAHV